jgi:hypothetical protein
MPVERRVFEHTMGNGRSFHAPDRPLIRPVLHLPHAHGGARSDFDRFCLVEQSPSED